MGTLNDYAAFTFWQEGYKLSDEDINSEDTSKRYFGYVDWEGQWYIMEVVYGEPKTHRFAKGTANFATNWGVRESLVYTRFDIAFN